MPNGAATIEDQRMMELQQKRLMDERTEEETAESGKEAKPAAEHFFNSGEMILAMAFTGAIEIIQWLLDLVPYAGWIVNGGITFVVGFSLFIWLTGKVAQGAPKRWYKAVYYGAAGGALPVIPGFLGAIIWLLIQDRKILGKVAGKAGEALEKTIKKVA